MNYLKAQLFQVLRQHFSLKVIEIYSFLTAVAKGPFLTALEPFSLCSEIRLSTEHWSAELHRRGHVAVSDCHPVTKAPGPG